MSVCFEITKFTNYQASCTVRYFSVKSFELGAYQYGKFYPDASGAEPLGETKSPPARPARRAVKGHFNAGTLLHPGHQLDGSIKLFRRPETRLSDLKAYLRTKGGGQSPSAACVIMNPKRRVGIRSNCSAARKREARSH